MLQNWGTHPWGCTPVIQHNIKEKSFFLVKRKQTSRRPQCFLQHTPLSFLLQTWRDIDYGNYDDEGDDGNDGDTDFNVADLIMNEMMMVEMMK